MFVLDVKSLSRGLPPTLLKMQGVHLITLQTTYQQQQYPPSQTMAA
jgi:hypothetical protein